MVPASGLRLLSAELDHIVSFDDNKEWQVRDMIKALTACAAVNEQANRKKLTRFIERHQAPQAKSVPMKMGDRIRRAAKVASVL